MRTLERFTIGLRTRRKLARIHPPWLPLRKGGILDCAPSPPYEGGARGGSLVEDIECMQTNREAIWN
jgi:hypothetical protein